MINFQHLVLDEPRTFNGRQPTRQPWCDFHIHPSSVAQPDDLIYLLTHGPLLKAKPTRPGTRGPLPGEGWRPRKYVSDQPKAGGARFQPATMRKCVVCRETKQMQSFPSLNGVAQKATTCKACVKAAEKARKK